jgi:glutathione S-transferase
VIEALKIKVPQNMTECFALIESDYLRGPWVMGEHYSVADGYLFTVSSWLEADGVDVNRFPKVKAHRDRVAARPAVARVMATYA